MDVQAAGLAIAGGSLALLLLVALHFLRPDLEPSSHVISEYALDPHGWLMALSFLALAVGCAGTLAVLFPRLDTMTGRAGLICMFAAAVGLALAAFFPMDPIATGHTNPSFAGRMHGVAAMIGNPGFMIGAVLLTIALRKNAAWEGVHVPLVVATILIWLSFAFMMASIAGMSKDSTDMGAIGWPNRLLWVAYCAWVMLAAWPALKVR
ncbi:MAG: DUF998 domain-containing protein [Steroidobacteraceae bacterium]